MSWIFYAVLAAAVYAITNFIDKYILIRKVKDYRGLIIYSAIISLIFGISYWIFAGCPLLPPQDALLLIISGVLTVFGLFFYFRALSIENTSTVIILMQFTPVITLFLSTSFLHEAITIYQIFGFILILFSIIGISIRKNNFRRYLSVALLFILFADFLWSCANVLFKFIVLNVSFQQIIPYESTGIFVGGLLLFILSPTIRKAFLITRHGSSKFALLFIFINEIIFISAKLLSFYAISLGPVALVGVIGSTQIFFGIIYGLLLNVFTHKIFGEDLSLGGLFKKLGFATIVFSGIWLMQY
ncbi:MAG TPA: EamA family transporter [Candidatus Peribacteraceae bacterium]|nr:EamA family transporter [Candidatus Peribacteraceae bacterium]